MLEVIEQTASRLFIPLTVGGIQSLDDITQLLNHGADKVSLNSSALKIHSSLNKRVINSVDNASA